jgi:hypothetical protein
MRPVRSVDSADLWFGAVFGLVAAGVFALAAIVLWDSATTSRTFWPNMLTIFGMWVVIGLLRGPLARMGRAARFLSWFCFGAAVVALVGFAKGEAFDPAMAAAVGLAWAVVDWLVGHFRSRREAERG